MVEEEQLVAEESSVRGKLLVCGKSSVCGKSLLRGKQLANMMIREGPPSSIAPQHGKLFRESGLSSGERGGIKPHLMETRLPVTDRGWLAYVHLWMDRRGHF